MFETPDWSQIEMAADFQDFIRLNSIGLTLASILRKCKDRPMLAALRFAVRLQCGNMGRYNKTCGPHDVASSLVLPGASRGGTRSAQ